MENCLNITVYKKRTNPRLNYLQLQSRVSSDEFLDFSWLDEPPLWGNFRSFVVPKRYHRISDFSIPHIIWKWTGKVGKDADRQEKCVCDMIITLGGFREEAAWFAWCTKELPGDPYGTRTRISSLRGWRPDRLDEGTLWWSAPDSNRALQPWKGCVLTI